MKLKAASDAYTVENKQPGWLLHNIAFRSTLS